MSIIKNIVLIKNKLNDISVFYNTCSHRGSQIFDQKEGKVKSPIIICPYHQWSYELSSGKLLNTTSLKLKNFDKKKIRFTKSKFLYLEGTCIC